MIIFYDPKTLVIKGMSDTEKTSMEFPFIEVKKKYHSAVGIYLEKVNGKLILKFKINLNV